MEDMRLYGETVRQMVVHRLARFYPPSPTNEPVFAWIWARSVTCGNPACKCTVPLTRTFSLSGGDTPKWVEPVVDQKRRSISFVVRTGGSDAPRGTVNDKQAKCLVCGRRISFEHIRTEGLSGRLGVMMMAMVIKAARGVRYASPSAEHIAAATESVPAWMPETDLPPRALGFRVQLYGMTHHRELFTQRQLLALSTISDCISDMRDRIMHDADGDAPYADAIMTYLACALSRMTDYHCSLATWNTGNENVRCLFQRQAVPMAWDFCEANPIEGKLSFGAIAEWVAGALTNLPSDCPPARVLKMDARAEPPGFSDAPVVSTDPPYFGNIGYADLSDFFYVWLRHILRDIDPQTFATLLTPKSQELIASPHRHNESKDAADHHFRSGFARVFENVRSASRGDVPATVYYAFKQQEDDAGEDERASTGWDSMLDGLVHAGYQITATWPVRTTKKARSVARGTNALASAVVIAVRQRVASAPLATRREFVSALKKELPEAIRMLQQGNIAPVDLAQASIGPGMAVFSRNSKVVESDGSAMRVRTALGIINQVLDEALAEQEGEFDADTRWALAWFGQFGMNEGPFGVAETLSKAKNTAVNALTEAGVVQAGAGRVKLRGRGELPQDWDPASDERLSVWECVQQLIWGLEKGGDKAAAVLVAKLGAGKSEESRALAYRLYSICERKKWAKEALAYNSLVIAWPEIMKLAQSSKPAETGELPFRKE
ncbi:MAG: hypothetical protein NTX53_07515 [candidate division WOR-3 bacterium]|nr:hypothetical protein [candidate division WOR-3 bacterium]